MKSPEEVKSEFVREWLSKANADLLASRHLLKEESKLAFVSAFHAQQAVEKALKALLVWHQIEFPKTHDIRQLLDLLTSPEPELSKELDEASSLTTTRLSTVTRPISPSRPYRRQRKRLNLRKES